MIILMHMSCTAAAVQLTDFVYKVFPASNSSASVWQLRDRACATEFVDGVLPARNPTQQHIPLIS